VMYTSLFLWTTNYKRILLVGPVNFLMIPPVDLVSDPN
jgi:hypothetical protein